MSVTPKKQIVTGNAAGGPKVARGRQNYKIIRRPIPGTDQFDVIVISNAWRDVPIQERRSMAARRAAADAVIRINRGELSHDAMTKSYTIIGLTVDEAISLGYLPYRIDAVLRGDEESLRDRVKDAIAVEETMETASGPQLRFESIEAAQDAYRRLQERVPGPHWIFVQEVPND